MKKVHSFGVVPIRKEEGEWKVLLILHREGNHWGFPKGKANPGETAIQTAERELKEETNLDIEEFLTTTSLDEEYQFRRRHELISKTACYFPAIVKGELRCQEEEIRDARWCSFPEALNQLSFKQARHICTEALKILGQC